MSFHQKLLGIPGELLACRGCLRTLAGESEAGLCGLCWAGLVPLPEGRCPRCALLHGEDGGCSDPVGWAQGDAFWDYHGGRPALGALLVPAIKTGEWGWRTALLRRMGDLPLPGVTRDVELVTAVPTAAWKRWGRGADLAEDTAAALALRLGRPFQRTLGRSWWQPAQAGRAESLRRRLPLKAFHLRGQPNLKGACVLLVDDVWTTGTSLLRCAERLKRGGAGEVRVLTLFRAQ